MIGPTAGAVVRESFAGSVERLRTHVSPLGDGGDPEDVHQARVATRRLRSDLRVFASLLDRGWARSLRRELRWLGRGLGQARDADVLLAHMRELSAAWTGAERDHAAPVLAALASQDEEANAALHERLRSGRTADLLVALAAAAQDLPLDGPHLRPAAEIFPPLLRPPTEALRASAARAVAKPKDRRLHHVRIAAKHVRYAADSVASAVPGARGLAEAAEELQGVLGEHQDAVVAERWLRRFGAVELAAGEREAAASAAAGWMAVYAAVVAAERRVEP